MLYSNILPIKFQDFIPLMKQKEICNFKRRKSKAYENL